MNLNFSAVAVVVVVYLRCLLVLGNDLILCVYRWVIGMRVRDYMSELRVIFHHSLEF
jgi:hypothetical protein